MAKEVKYLGITLDDKLSFCSNIEKITENAVRILWTCRRMVRNIWVLKPSMMHWLYTMVVVPVKTYSSVIWWHKTKSITADRKLQDTKNNNNRGFSSSNGATDRSSSTTEGGYGASYRNFREKDTTQ